MTEEQYSEFWGRAYDDIYEHGARRLNIKQCRLVFTMNTWTDEKKAKTKKLIEEGYWVYFDNSDCIRWAYDEYGDNLILTKNERDGEWYVRLEEFENDEKINRSRFFYDNVSFHLLTALKNLINIIFIDETADTPTKRIQHYYSWRTFKEIEKLFYESRHYEENK